MHKPASMLRLFIFTANSDVRHVELLKNTPKKLCIMILPSLSRAARCVSKRLIFLHLKAKKIADKYRVSWSSLYVNGWNNGKEKRNDLTRMGFKYARNNTAQFKNELKKKINQLLK